MINVKYVWVQINAGNVQERRPAPLELLFHADLWSYTRKQGLTQALTRASYKFALQPFTDSEWFIMNALHNAQVLEAAFYMI